MEKKDEVYLVGFQKGEIVRLIAALDEYIWSNDRLLSDDEKSILVGILNRLEGKL